MDPSAEDNLPFHVKRDLARMNRGEQRCTIDDCRKFLAFLKERGVYFTSDPDPKALHFLIYDVADRNSLNLVAKKFIEYGTYFGPGHIYTTLNAMGQIKKKREKNVVKEQSGAGAARQKSTGDNEGSSVSEPGESTGGRDFDNELEQCRGRISGYGDRVPGEELSNRDKRPGTDPE